jgi:DNA-binding HxlR family transcriptional regulator
MHALFNEMKRAYWKSRTFQARIAERYGLTPSRFEMLLAIAQQPGRSVPQSWLPGILGCSRPVVSRMLRALEKLGLVERDLYVGVAPTGLTCPVSLTDDGLAKLEALAEEMIKTGCIELAVHSVACEDWISKESRDRDPAALTAGLRGKTSGTTGSSIGTGGCPTRASRPGSCATPGWARASSR